MMSYRAISFLCLTFLSPLLLSPTLRGDSTTAPSTTNPATAPTLPPSFVELKKDWPTVFDINLQQTITIKTPTGESAVKLLKITHLKEPDYWTKATDDKKIFVAAHIDLLVDGQPVTLIHRPYQMPQTVGKLRLYVETTKEWQQDSLKFYKWEKPLNADLSLSAVPAGATWGPSDFLFPIADYRWRSATYENTWQSLVPFNLLYYHHGEDLGAVPDKLDLVAVRDGVIHDSPIPTGSARSNYVTIDMGGGMLYGYAHMNYATIDPTLKVGTPVKRGQKIAQTGMTYEGQPKQFFDPHVHMDLSDIHHLPDHPEEQSHFPTMIESYFRSYDDSAIALAGGFGFADVGSTYRLDGTRSVARPGRKIVSYQWKLHDGKFVNTPTADVAYPKPGYYAEELIIKTDDGYEDRDAIHVRVSKPDQPNDTVGQGWMYYTPARLIYPGTEIKFLSRLNHVNKVMVDYGDGTTPYEVGWDFTHTYKNPGVYTVSLQGIGANNEPVQAKIRVRVLEKPETPKP